MKRGRVTFFYFASSTFVVSPYSILTATIGSTLVALHPGTNAATTTVSKSTTTAPPKLTGSLTPTPTNMLPTSLPIIKLNPTPTITPHAPNFAAPANTSRIILCFSAPSAILIPISKVRCATEYATVPYTPNITSSIAKPANDVISTARNLSVAIDSLTIASIVVNRIAIDASRLAIVSLTSFINSSGITPVRITMWICVPKEGCCAIGMYSGGPGISASDSCLTSPTTPTTVIHLSESSPH